MFTEIPTIAILTFASMTGWLPVGHRWAPGRFPVEYCITANARSTNLTTSQQRAAITQGIDAWRASGSTGSGGLSCTVFDAAAQPASRCRPSLSPSDGQNNIFWETNWQEGSGTIGVTWASFRGPCGVVADDRGTRRPLDCTEDADIELNDVDYFWDTIGRETDVASIIAHEYGHFIGLDHCNDNGTCDLGTAVMFAGYAGGALRVPLSDDVQGACTLYPGTQGDVGWPCSRAGDCGAAPLCVSPARNGYCSRTCGPCPTGFACGPNPANASQRVCLRDDGLNRGLCELCQSVSPDACADDGVCVTGIPETDQARCATPCPNPSGPAGGCPERYDCAPVNLGNNQTGDYCLPKSSNCTDLENFREIERGQACDGDPVCAAGLECIGICTDPCTGAPGRGSCPSGYACTELLFDTGLAAYCAPPVDEGQSCTGVTACSTGPCLVQRDQSTCFRDCARDPNACNNAQQCNTYPLQGGSQVSICEPPGVPPRMGGDAGVPDAGCACDVSSACDNSCGACDPDCGALDAGVSRPDAGPSGTCRCDETTACDPGCDSCDPECLCACDLSLACDPGCEDCDPECQGGGCSGCTSTTTPGSRWWVLGLFGAALALLGLRRVVR